MAGSRCLIFIASLIFSIMSCYALETPNTNLGLNIVKIQKLTGQTGQLDQDKRIYKITIPRDDLKILISGMQMTPDMGLSSWITFNKTDNQTSVNGDLVLLQDQINPVMSVALANGLQVTGLHNPYLWDSPRVMFMHIKGEGNELQLATAIGQVLKKVKATNNGGGDFPLGNFDFLRTTLDAHKIDVILGQTGQFKDDVYKVEFGDGIKATDTETNRAMALNTWVTFAGSDNEAVVNGTMVLHESELQNALVKLRNAQIYILAIYQHMVSDDKYLVFINFWGVGNTQLLAKTLRSVFFTAQNNNPANITVGGALPGIFTANAETGVEMTPVQLSLYKNDNCGYAKAKELYTSVDTIQNINVDYIKQLGATLHMALYLTQKIVSEKMAKFVSFLPATSQMIQSAEENAQVLPSAKNLLLKLSVVSNNVPKFVKLFASTSVITTVKSDEKIVVPELSAQTALSESRAIETHREIFAPSARMILAKLSAGEKNNIEILSMQPLNSLSQPAISVQIASTALPIAQNMTNKRLAPSAVHAYAYAYKNKFVTSYANISKLLAYATFTAVEREHRDINEFAILYVSISKSISYAASLALSETADLAHSYVISRTILFIQLSDLLKNKVIQLARLYTNQSPVLLATMTKPLVAVLPMVKNTAKELTQLSNRALAVAASSTLPIKKVRASYIATKSHIPDAIRYAYAYKNRFVKSYANIFKLLAYTTSTAVEHEHRDINEFAILYRSVSKSISYTTSLALSETADLAHSYVISCTILFIRLSDFLKNKVKIENKIPSMLKPLREILSPMLLSSLALSTPVSVAATTIPVAKNKEVIIKSLPPVLSQAQYKIIATSFRKTLAASLPMPQHKVIRVATLATLSSVIPVTQHKVKTVPVIQHKIIKVAKLPSQSLPNTHSIKNYNTPRVKSAVSLAHNKIVEHRKHPNKQLSVALRTVHNKHTGYVPGKGVIYSAAHNINRQPVEKITEKPRKIAHAMAHEENWNTEQLTPEPHLPIRVAQRHVQHEQEDFDAGPAVIGAYPYDEEPISDGFSS